MAKIKPIYDRTKLTEPQARVWDAIENPQSPDVIIWLFQTMEWKAIDQIAGMPIGSYQKDPVPVYRKMLLNGGVMFLDQWIPDNPLSMGESGYTEDSAMRDHATTGAEKIVVDGMEIKEPEDVVAHLEKYAFPELQKAIADFDEDKVAQDIVNTEQQIQSELGDQILKTGYYSVMGDFPRFRYYTYGYSNYFMAVALYPEVIEKDFRLQADLAYLGNKARARAFKEGNFPPLYRLDHDMADSRGMLVNIKVLDKIWLPHFARALEPMLKAEIKLIWHSDGNLMDLYPRLLEVGLAGFQGFQYECGMDYQKICRMKTKAGTEPFVIAGVSVTRTLPFGKPEDIKKEMAFLVENGPKDNTLALGCSSSITPGVPMENLKTMIEGFWYYRKHGRRKSKS